jgi:4-hydroxy-tetrahydrodipicolinate reductase
VGLTETTAQAPLRVGIAGALGRMGRAVAEVIAEEPRAELAALADRPDAVGQAVGDLQLATPEALIAAADVVIDFSTPEASAALATLAAAAKRPALVIGATGWTETDEMTLWSAAKQIAIVKSGNYSLGVNVLAGLVEQTARRLGARDWDIEISEAHHHRKIDAPSGTALMLGEAAARGRDVGLREVEVRARDGITGPRPAGAIGFSSLRAGGIVGEHQVVFASEDEVLTLSHSARDRRLFARGAVAAALWAARRPPGLYDMMDVLGFRAG